MISLPTILPLFVALFAALSPLTLPMARNFEYEYLSLMAYVLFLAMPLAGLIPGIRTPAPAKTIGLTALATLALTSLPGFIAFRTSLCPCSEREFWFWWLVQTLPHLFWGLCGYYAMLSLRARLWSRVQCVSLWLGLHFLLFAHMAWTLWTGPQKRITHILSGFIHGAIYDSWIPLDAGVLWIRLGHLTLSLIILTLALPFLQKRRKYFTVCGLLIFLLTTYGLGLSYPSQTHGLGALERLLPSTIRGQQFTLHYLPSDQKVDQDKIELLAASAEFHIQDLNAILHTENVHVHIFIYPDRTRKKLWFGGDATDITDVVTPSIHITLDHEWPHPTLRHELVHALSSDFAFHGLGFHPNLAFTEGIAVALAPTEDELSLHEGSARLIQTQRLPAVETLFSPLFWSEAGRRAYTAAGSLIQFLLETRGSQNVRLLYQGRSWMEAIGTSPEDITRQWMSFLQSTFPPRRENLHSEAMFRYSGILNDRCPHSKASLSQSKAENSALFWRQARDWQAKRDYLPWLASFERNPNRILDEHRQALNKLWESYDPKTAEQLLKDIRLSLAFPPKYLEDIWLYLMDIDLLIALGKDEQARDKLDSYRRGLADIQLSSNLDRQFLARQQLLASRTANDHAWLSFLSGRQSHAPYEPQASNAMARYLTLRNVNAENLSVADLLRYSDPNATADLPTEFLVEWYRSLGMKWQTKDDWEQAAAALERAAEAAGSGRKAALSLMAREARAFAAKSKEQIDP